MFKKVLVPVDVLVSADTQNLLQAARKLNAGWDAEIHVATVVPNVGMAIVGSYLDANFESKSHAAASEQLSAAIETAGISATPHVLTGTVYDSVIALASEIDADLIIIGAHQPKLRDYLLGANAAKVVRHSRQSVLVIREPDQPS